MRTEAVMVQALDILVNEDKEEELGKVFQQILIQKKIQNDETNVNDYTMNDDEEKINNGYFSHLHWVKEITETKIKLRDLSKLIVALVDHGSEINIIALKVYDIRKWSIDTVHGWTLRIDNNQRGELYSACLAVKMRIEEIEIK